MSSTIRMPQLGESVVEGTVGKWLVQEGQRVDRDQAVVEILTDKADSEVPSPEAGVVTKILAPEGAIVAVGDALCEVDANAAEGVSAAASSAGQPAVPSAAAASAARDSTAVGQTSAGTHAAPAGIASSPGTQPAPSGGNGVSPANYAATPSARRLAREHGVDLGLLSAGGEGRVTRDDVMRAAAPAIVESAPTVVDAPSPAARPAPVPQAMPSGAGGLGAFRLPPYSPREGDEVIPLSRRRRIIADHMVYSKLTSPHVVTFAECDLNKTSLLRKQNKARLAQEGVNLTMLAFVAAATARALREYRAMNARMLEDSYVLLQEINLGIAVDTEEGLVVPVVRQADELTVRGLARAIDGLAKKAREGNLAPDDLAGKSFTISNPGRRGNLVGGAIISQPNVGILRTGEIKKRVVVVEHEGEDLMAIHPVMQMALSYDHRIVDGVAANGFLYRVTEILEAGDFSL